MNVIAVIPARYGSTRFPGKPLKMLLDKPLLQWVVEGARKSRLLADVIVATDDERIEDLCQKIKVKSIMTSPDCATGSDRIYQATKELNCDVILNVQGDEPQIDETYIDPLVTAFTMNPELELATLGHSLEVSDIENRNAVKVLLNQNQEAIYFSRYGIPFSRSEFKGNDLILKHIGLYAYSKKFLEKFCTTPPCFSEQMESLEQLRALHLGATIKVLKVNKPTLGVDTPEDLHRLEILLSK